MRVTGALPWPAPRSRQHCRQRRGPAPAKPAPRLSLGLPWCEEGGVLSRTRSFTAAWIYKPRVIFYPEVSWHCWLCAVEVSPATESFTGRRAGSVPAPLAFKELL